MSSVVADTRPDAPTHLMDRRSIANELGITLGAAETLMRAIPKIPIGRRIFVEREEVYAELKRRAKR